MAAPREQTNKIDAHADMSLRDMVTYRIQRLAFEMARNATHMYRERFGISLGEGRALGALGETGTVSLNQLARIGRLDKGQMSRVIAGLVKRGLVLRERGADGGNAISLSLTEDGQQLFETLREVVLGRDGAYVDAMTDEERAAFERIITKFSGVARNQR